MTLTEQWKKGELESGWYYVNFYSVGVVMQEYLPEHNGFGYDEKNLIQEVLAPVPSYEKWQELKEHCKVLKEALTNHEEIRNGLYNECDNLEKENQQLKELLLSSRGFVDKERITLETSGFGHNEYCRRTKELLTAIDNAIGEK